MKTTVVKLFVTLFTLMSLQSFAFNGEFVKKINKSFNVKPDASVKIQNKFGKVECINWDKPAVSIEVTITVDVSSQEKANKVFEKIKITITGNESAVTAITSFTDNFSDNGNKILNIDYVVNLPKTINLDIDHKFGDVILNEITGKTTLNLSYGTLTAKKLTNNANTFIIKFSDANIGILSNANIDLKYSELDVEQAKVLTVDSKFSEFMIKKAVKINHTSGYDDTKIGMINEFDINSSFSEINIDELQKSLDLKMDYGGIVIQQVSGDFEALKMVNNFANAEIGFEPASSFNIDAVCKFGELKYPVRNSKVKHEEISYTTNKYKGTVGQPAAGKTLVIIESKNSDVVLEFR